MVFKANFLSFLRVGLLILITALGDVKSSNAQLIIYQGSQQTGTSATCLARTIYKGVTIPASLDNQITSIKLNKGFMATLAENEDGSGNSYPFMAITNDLNINLNASLDKKVSFIRVLPLANTLKKGAGYKSPASAPNDNSVVDQLNVSWLYDWGSSDYAKPNRDYSLMAWGANAANSTNVAKHILKDSVSHLLSFNEPDNTNQSNVTFVNAVPLHKNLAATGYRLGSPAPEEGNAQTGRWLGDFMALAETNNVRVDYMAIHWYDWGSYSSTLATSPNVTNLFNRFKSYVNNIYATYNKPIWITEFNANRNTTSATHEAFIALALPWLESQSFVERYAYFFPPALPPTDVNGVLTPIGTAYKNFNASTLAIKNNFDGTPDILNLEAEDATFSGTPAVTNANCTNASGGQTITSAISGTQKVTFNNIFAATSTNYTLRIYYFAKTARTIGVKVNANTINIISIPISGTLWCFEGGSAGFYDVTIPLDAGNNIIELSNAPVLDRIQIIKLPPSVLPITLVDFSADVKEDGVKLNWQTAQEVNNQYFEVLKSDNNNEFKPLTQIKGAVNSNAPKYYSFTDYNPIIGTNYYQLKQVDLDGKSETFKPIAVKFGLATDEFKILSSSEESLTVSIASSKVIEGIISYVGLDGRLLYKQKIYVTNGLNTFPIPVNKSTGQIGIISFSTNGEQKSLKVYR
jgi:hypothetical protein